MNSLPTRFVEWPQLRIRPTLAYQGEPPAIHRHQQTTNGFYSFWFVEKGKVQVAGKFGKMSLRAGDWILFPLFLSKRQDFDEGTRILSIGFDASWSGEIPWMDFRNPMTGHATARDVLIMSAKHVVSAFSAGSRACPLSDRTMDAAGIARLQSRLFAFLEKLTPVALDRGGKLLLPGSHDPRLHKLVSELRLSPSIRPLPYARWKKEIGLSRVHIDRLFRLDFDCSPKQLRNRFLMAAVKRELITARSSIKELATAFGFSDSSHICRWFRRWNGNSPEQFRSHGIE